MRICIVTTHRSHNYGAVLQAFALSSFLKNNYNASIVFLDYRPVSGKDAYRLLPRIRSLKSLKSFIVALLKLKDLNQRYKGFEYFMSKEFNLTKVYSNTREIESSPPDADYYLTGSDQVFRYKNCDSDPFFLCFAKTLGKPSVAYAPSFGVATLADQFKIKVAALLNGIDHLSCRESEGAKIIENLTGKKALVVVDPVFLLKPEEWDTFAKFDKSPTVPFILCYALVGIKNQLEIAKMLKMKTGLPIITITSPLKSGQSETSISTANPYEFVGLFSKASYIVTDSFHGTAFSVLFRKPFISYIAIPEASSRIINLLERIGLAKHVFFAPCFSFNDIEKVACDYQGCTIEQEIKISKNYLSGVIAKLNEGK